VRVFYRVYFSLNRFIVFSGIFLLKSRCLICSNKHCAHFDDTISDDSASGLVVCLLDGVADAAVLEHVF